MKSALTLLLCVLCRFVLIHARQPLPLADGAEEAEEAEKAEKALALLRRPPRR